MAEMSHAQSGGRTARREAQTLSSSSGEKGVWSRTDCFRVPILERRFVGAGGVGEDIVGRRKVADMWDERCGDRERGIDGERKVGVEVAVIFCTVASASPVFSDWVFGWAARCGNDGAVKAQGRNLSDGGHRFRQESLERGRWRDFRDSRQTSKTVLEITQIKFNSLQNSTFA